MSEIEEVLNKPSRDTVLSVGELKKILEKVPDNYVLLSLDPHWDNQNDNVININAVPFVQIIKQDATAKIDGDIINSGALFMNLLPIGTKHIASKMSPTDEHTYDSKEEVLYIDENIDEDDMVDDMKEFYKAILKANTKYW